MKLIYGLLLAFVLATSFSSSYAGQDEYTDLVMDGCFLRAGQIIVGWSDYSVSMISSVVKENNSISISKFIYPDQSLPCESIDFSFSAKYIGYKRTFEITRAELNTEMRNIYSDGKYIDDKVFETIRKFLNALLNVKNIYKDGATIKISHFIITRGTEDIDIDNEFVIRTDGRECWAITK